MVQVLKNRSLYAVLFSVALSVIFVAALASAATTISTNISTGGTLTVSGDSTFTGDIFASSTMAVTGQASFYDQLVIDSASSDPTGVSQGSIYWNTADKLIRVYDGTDWRTVASSTSGSGGLILGATNGVRFNTIATGYMALGTSTLPIATISSGNSLLFLNSTTTATVPLLISGVGGQSGDLIRAVNGVYTEVFAVDPRGAASTTDLTAAGNLWVNGYATTTSAGALSLESTLGVNGNVTLGDAIGDVITITGAATTTNSLNVGGVFSVKGFATTTVAVGDNSATTTMGSVYGSALGIGTTTPSLSSKLGVNGDVHIGGTGTTTISLNTSAVTARGTCIQMKATDNDVVRIYVNNANALVVEAGACSGGGSL